MMMIAADRIAKAVVQFLDQRRLAHGHRPMSDRERDKLIGTTEQIIDKLQHHERGRTLPDDFRHDLTRQAQSYYRDEWYEIDQQIDYVHLVRNRIIEETTPGPEDLQTILDFFDTLTLLTVEASRRPARYEWPLLAVVGFGHLAKNKLVEPLRELLPNNPFDLWIIDVRDSALDEARQAFKGLPVRIIGAGEARAQFRNHPAATKIVYVATDSNSHLKVVKAYADIADVIAIEKPLCTDLADLKEFEKLANAKGSRAGLVVVDHYSFRRAHLIVENLKKHAAEFINISDATKITFRMLEQAPVDAARAAAHEGVIFDMLPHLFPFVVALVTADLPHVTVKKVKRWKYKEAPKEWGETFVHAVFQPKKGPRVEAYAGKGVAQTEKEVVIEGKDFRILLDLMQGRVFVTRTKGPSYEFGASNRDLGYGFVIHELLNSKSLGFLGLHHATEIVRLLDKTRKASKKYQTYDLGAPAPA